MYNKLYVPNQHLVPLLRPVIVSNTVSDFQRLLADVDLYWYDIKAIPTYWLPGPSPLVLTTVVAAAISQYSAEVSAITALKGGWKS